MFSSSGEVVDEKRERLSTSLAAYDAANGDDWVAVTDSEINNIATQLSATTTYDVEDASASLIIDVPTGDFTLVHNIDSYPIDDYVIGFSVYVLSLIHI